MAASPFHRLRIHQDNPDTDHPDTEHLDTTEASYSMTTSIQELPGEVFKMILSGIDPEDYLNVKLVSKHFCKWAYDVFKLEDMAKTEVIQGQTSFEASVRLKRGQRLELLICTLCGRVKTRNQFSDHQAAKTNPTRFCISCGISNRTYTKNRRPTINGDSYIPCWLCRMAVPLSSDWQERLTTGKADMTKILQHLKSEGQQFKYRTADGRLLTWVSEPELLAFCVPCLRVMKLDGRPGRITDRCN